MIKINQNYAHTWWLVPIMCNYDFPCTPEGLAALMAEMEREVAIKDTTQPYPMMAEFLVWREFLTKVPTIWPSAPKPFTDHTINERVRDHFMEFYNNGLCKYRLPTKCSVQITIPKDYPVRPLKIIVHDTKGHMFGYLPNGRGIYEITDWQTQPDKYN